jgi:hypothetical protein
LSDASLLYLYENIRQQAAADIRNGPYHFLGEAAKERAEEIRRENDRRDLFALPSTGHLGRSSQFSLAETICQGLIHIKFPAPLFFDLEQPNKPPGVFWRVRRLRCDYLFLKAGAAVGRRD